MSWSKFLSKRKKLPVGVAWGVCGGGYQARTTQWRMPGYSWSISSQRLLASLSEARQIGADP